MVSKAGRQGQGKEMASKAGRQGQGKEMASKAGRQGQGKEMASKAGRQGQGKEMASKAKEKKWRQRPGVKAKEINLGWNNNPPHPYSTTTPPFNNNPPYSTTNPPIPLLRVSVFCLTFVSASLEDQTNKVSEEPLNASDFFIPLHASLESKRWHTSDAFWLQS